jgi:predicted outer membrane protein
MRSQLPRYTQLAAIWFAMVAIAACKERAGSVRGTAEAPGGDSTISSSTSPADTAQSPSAAAGRLTDAKIVALLDEANAADSASGAFALRKASSPDVKAFAKLMMGEHHALRAQGQQLARRLNVTPELPADDPLKPAA